MAKRQRRRRAERRRGHAQRRGWQTQRSVITGVGLVAGAIGVGPAAAQAAYLYVGSNGDGTGATDCATYTNTDCTLRQAIADANADSNFDYIYFKSGITGTITIGSQLSITNPVGIYGPGADTLTVSAAGANSRIFDVNPTDPSSVIITGLTLSEGNVAGDGGAIRNEDAYLEIANAVLSGNTASGNGGAIYEAGNDPNDGYYTYISRSTFSGNTADNGGAIYSANQVGRIEGSTFLGNAASATGGLGGAVYGFGSGSVFDSTMSGNTASGGGGGIHVGADLTPLYNTIVANSNSPEDVYTAGTNFAYYDLIENPGSASLGSSNITGVDPQLGGLAANGTYNGTPTLKPAAGSRVVDQGYSYVSDDQRLFDRTIDNPFVVNAPGGNGTDIGSVELTLGEGPQAPPPSGTTSSPASAPKKKKKKCKKKKKHRSVQSAKKKKCKKKKKRSAAARIERARSMWRSQGQAGHWGDHAWRMDASHR